MHARPRIVCIGSVLWDVIGRAPTHLRLGSDLPGRITRVPGGVAMNIAMTLRRFGLTPALLSAVGRDAEGEDLVAQAMRLGLDCRYLYRSDDLPTDVYMAIEGANGLIAAIADAHSLEAAGAKILAPLHDGRLGSGDAPFAGVVALDGNLTEDLLAAIAADPAFAAADLRLAPASPGKALRLLPLITHPRATLYVNRDEAGAAGASQLRQCIRGRRRTGCPGRPPGAGDRWRQSGGRGQRRRHLHRLPATGAGHPGHRRWRHLPCRACPCRTARRLAAGRLRCRAGGGGGACVGRPAVVTGGTARPVAGRAGQRRPAGPEPAETGERR